MLEEILQALSIIVPQQKSDDAHPLTSVDKALHFAWENEPNGRPVKTFNHIYENHIDTPQKCKSCDPTLTEEIIVMYTQLITQYKTWIKQPKRIFIATNLHLKMIIMR